MNERIHEVAVQIGFPMDYENPAWAYEQSIYKFAELIVRECAELADESTSQPYDSYGEKIRKHFGIEE